MKMTGENRVSHEGEIECRTKGVRTGRKESEMKMDAVIKESEMKMDAVIKESEMKMDAVIKESEMKSVSKFVLGLFLVLIVFVSPALGSTIELAYKYLDAGGKQRSVVHGHDSTVANGAMTLGTQNAAGALAEQLAETSWGYCVEKGQYSDFSYLTYTVDTVEGLLGTAKGLLLRQLWEKHYNKNWEKQTAIYYGGDQGGWQLGHPAVKPESVTALAFSYVVYEIRYDFDGVNLESLNLAAGSFRGKVLGTFPVASLAVAGGWLAGLKLPGDYTGDLPTLVGLSNEDHQDMIVEIVPEPMTMLLLGTGVVPLLLSKRRRR